jgi:hypothetical protein
MKRLLTFLSFCALSACASNPETAPGAQAGADPLRNTKKLAAEGHATLYRNGAFQVPMTTIHLIPPAPSTLELAAELAGMRALQSFQESVKHARESVNLAKTGVDRSANAATTINRGADAVAQEARGITRFGADALREAPGTTTRIIAASVSRAKPVYSGTQEVGEKIAGGSLELGRGMGEATDRAASGLMSGTVAGAGAVAGDALALSRRHASFAAEKFVKGYAALPAKVETRAGNVAAAASPSKFVTAFERSREWPSKASGEFTDLMRDAARNYTRDVGSSFNNAAAELGRGVAESGTFAVLKSLRWVLQGVFWEATIKPVGKMTAGALGYVTVNGVAYPALVTANEGGVVANLAAQVTWNSAATAYEITAPTATAAVAGLLSAGELVGGEALAGTGLVAGTVASAGVYATGKTAAAGVAGGGYAAGKTVEYVAAPLSAVGVVGGGTVVGVVAGTAVGATGATAAATGVTAEVLVRTAGVAAGGTVGAGGAVASVAAGAALGTYELAKAVVVPAGHELGAGIVLGYGTISQLGAQSVLAVSDASYMVLSLEGPRSLLYAVKGNVDKGENIPAGAVLDLKAMHKAGETLYAVPASEEEVKRVVDSMRGALPETKAPSEAAVSSDDS